MKIPTLRFGTRYQSLNEQPIVDLGSKEPLGTLSYVDEALIGWDCRNKGLAKKARKALAALPIERRIAICVAAGNTFEFGTVEVGGIPQTADDYTADVARTSGLPYTLVRANTKRIADALRQTREIIRGLSRDLPLEVFDTGLGHQGSTVRLIPRVDALGCLMPNNSPGVNVVWLIAIALGIPVLIRPGSAEPFTPYRLIQAFIQEGIPAEAFGFYPCDHRAADRIPLLTKAAIVFGSDDTVQKWSTHPLVQVHGTGYSKLIIGEDRIDRWREMIPELVRNMAANSGRSCFKVSRYIVPRFADEIADAMARELVKILPLPLDDPNALLSAIAMPQKVPGINQTITNGITDGGAIDFTARHREGPRVVEFQGRTYLLPTLIRCNSEHTLAGQEFLFPYAAVVEASNQDAFAQLGSTLSLAVYSDDEALHRQALFSGARLVTVNEGTWSLKRDQPHEENLVETLFHRLSFFKAA